MAPVARVRSLYSGEHGKQGPAGVGGENELLEAGAAGGMASRSREARGARGYGDLKLVLSGVRICGKTTYAQLQSFLQSFSKALNDESCQRSRNYVTLKLPMLLQKSTQIADTLT